MLKALANEAVNMVVVKAVIDIFSFFPIPYDSGTPQHPQLVGYCRLIHAKNIHQIADAQFRLAQGAEDPYPGMVAQYLEKRSKIKQLVIRGHCPLDAADGI